MTRRILVVIDGAKALRAAVVRMFDHPVIGRCQLHKLRNVTDRLPDRLASTVAKRMRKAYHPESALAAEAQLEALAKELDRTHGGAAASLREGLAEPLTVLRLGVPPTLARRLRSTNSIESMISIARTHSRNVKHWQSGNTALRWCAWLSQICHGLVGPALIPERRLLTEELADGACRPPPYPSHAGEGGAGTCGPLRARNAANRRDPTTRPSRTCPRVDGLMFGLCSRGRLTFSTIASDPCGPTREARRSLAPRRRRDRYLTGCT
jgi:hypothetical protein